MSEVIFLAPRPGRGVFYSDNQGLRISLRYMRAAWLISL
jgi:hypothetical protein